MENTAQFDWLISASTPSIRYITRTRLLGQPEADPAVQQARQDMRSTGPIPAILARQSESGAWKADRSFYTPKYTSTHWSMLLMAELEAGAADPRPRLGANYMLSAATDNPLHWLKENDHGLSCFWGNLLYYVVNCGLQEDPRLERVIANLTREVKTGWSCPYNSGNFCSWGAARALWAFAWLPPAASTPAVQAAIESACHFLLEEYDLMKPDYPTTSKGKVSVLWRRLSFPLFYQADRLLVLRALARLEMLDFPGARAALDWLASLRQEDGRWHGSSPFHQRTWPALADSQEIERWVSLQSALVLKAANRA